MIVLADCDQPQNWYISDHYSEDRYTRYYDDYHICIGYDNRTGKAVFVQTRALHKMGMHVWHRNTGNIGVSMMGGTAACPLKRVQKEMMAYVNAELSVKFNIPLSRIHPHYWWADKDGYGVKSGSRDIRTDIGKDNWEFVTNKTKWYKVQLETGKMKFTHKFNM